MTTVTKQIHFVAKRHGKVCHGAGQNRPVVGGLKPASDLDPCILHLAFFRQAAFFSGSP